MLSAISYVDITMNPLPKVNDINIMMGCDPEFFFKQEGKIIGAEQVLPKGGLATDGKIIIDGVQAELNPRPNTCREMISSTIAASFTALQASLVAKGANISVDFSRTVEISKEKLDELSENSKKFGCAPSLSVCDTKSTVKIADVNPEEYRTRAAGGHIHLGKGEKVFSDGNVNPIYRAIDKDYERVVQMLDIICGNTCVLVDRDKGNIERRKLYGRAGEYRLPKHGLEYRTLSNFWLTSTQLMSLAFGLARLAVQLMADKNHEQYYDAFMSKVKLKDVQDAINNNDFDQAGNNFIAIEKLLMQVTAVNGRYPIHRNNIEAFHYFVDVIQSKGLSHWFPDDPMKHWTKLSSYPNHGFSDYLMRTITPIMNKDTKAKTA